MLAYFYKYPIESVSVFVTLFPIMAMAYRMDYRHSVLRYAFWLFIAKFIIESSMLCMAVGHYNNLFLYNSYLLISFCFLAMLFYKAYDLRVDKKLVIYCGTLYFMIFVWDWYTVGHLQSLQFSGTLECVLVILFVMRYFWELLRSLKVVNLLNFPLFWLCAGLLCYYCSLTFVAPLYNILDRPGGPSGFEFLVAIPPIVDCFFLALVAVGFLKSD